MNMTEPVPFQYCKICPDSHYNRLPMESFWSDSTTSGGKSKLVVVGHRGCGENKTFDGEAAPDRKCSVRENTIASFTIAARNGADFVEFDVQVTKDGHPVIFHDDLITVEEQGLTVSRSIGELSLDEFLSIGLQKDDQKAGRSLVRKALDGSFCKWTATIEDSFCTLKDAFEQVLPTVGFNIEVKVDDTDTILSSELSQKISFILLDVNKYAMGRKVFFSSFHPDAAVLLRKEQSMYPVFFLTKGGLYMYKDPRRNSIEAAIDVCLEYGLQGLVSEVRAVLQNPSLVSLVKQASLSLLTYGELNSMAETVNKQGQLGVNGVIVDDMGIIPRNLARPPVPPTSYLPNIALKAFA